MNLQAWGSSRTPALQNLFLLRALCVRAFDGICIVIGSNGETVLNPPIEV